MHADLMGAAGVQVAEDEGGFGGLIGGDDFVIGDCGFPGGWGPSVWAAATDAGARPVS